MSDLRSSSRAIPGRENTDHPDVESQPHDADHTTTAPWELRTGRGGPNSIDNFARSWQRAAGFFETIPRSPSHVYADDNGEESVDGERAPLLAGTMNDYQSTSHATDDEDADFDADTTITPRDVQSLKPSTQTLPDTGATPAPSTALDAPPTTTTTDPAITVKRIPGPNGRAHTVIVGHSTVPQTIFNSVNVLIGVGLLSLPLAFQYSGWLLGLLLMAYAAASTIYTARILAKCMDVAEGLATYADLAYVSFGARARVAVSVLFCLELTGACVALVVLFADSVDALVPGYGVLMWKVVCGALLVPLAFVPLHLLSLSSILGIFSCTSILAILLIDAFVKPHAPGSLLEPARTTLLPMDWNKVPLSIGLMMAPWGGHGVFPNIYKDMRHPWKYDKSLVYTYSFTSTLDMAMGAVGWLMFGDAVYDEVTSNILLSDAYPKILSLAMIAFIAIIPLTKIPLNCRPLVATVETLTGLRDSPPNIVSPTLHALLTALIKIATVAFFIAIAIAFPYFDRIMALVGASLCMLICVVLPLAFHLKLFGSGLGWGEWVANWVLGVVSCGMGVLGTWWAFVPPK